MMLIWSAELLDTGIVRNRWRRSQHLEIPERSPERGQKQHETPYTYPMDIRLNRISPGMWWKRIFGKIAGVKVYNSFRVEA